MYPCKTSKPRNTLHDGVGLCPVCGESVEGGWLFNDYCCKQGRMHSLHIRIENNPLLLYEMIMKTASGE